MKVAWAIGCADIDSDENGLLTLHGPGGDTSPVEGFPCDEAWVLLAVCLSAAYDEVAPGTVHAVRWTVTDPDGRVVNADGWDLELDERSSWHHAGEDAHLVQRLRLEFAAQRAGQYAIEFRVNGGAPYRLRHYFALLDDLF